MGCRRHPADESPGDEGNVAAVLWQRRTCSPQEEKEYVGDALREIAPEAEKAGVILGLENTISAEDNVRIMDRRGRRQCWFITISETRLKPDSMSLARLIGWEKSASARCISKTTLTIWAKEKST